VLKKALGKEALCRVLKTYSAKKLFADCQKYNPRQRAFLLSVFFYRGFFVWHSAKSFFVE
jgi:hypothetical protein